MGGPKYDNGGGGPNYQCLPEEPEWDDFVQGEQTASRIYGVEYERSHSQDVFDDTNSGSVPRYNNPAPCAVCYVNRHSILMVPAKMQCPDGWRKEYGGFLVGDLYGRYRTDYVCFDKAPEIAVGRTNGDQGVIYPVEVICGTLPCSKYINYREMTCVVCSK